MPILSNTQFDVARIIATGLTALALVHYLDKRLDRLETLVLQHIREDRPCQSSRTYERQAWTPEIGKPYSITWPRSAFHATDEKDS